MTDDTQNHSEQDDQQMFHGPARLDAPVQVTIMVALESTQQQSSEYPDGIPATATIAFAPGTAPSNDEMAEELVRLLDHAESQGYRPCPPSRFTSLAPDALRPRMEQMLEAREDKDYWT